jgi:hemolysin activation/secretion protein
MGHRNTARGKPVWMAGLGLRLLTAVSLTSAGLATSHAFADASPAPGPTHPVAGTGVSREQLNPASQLPAPRRRPGDLFTAPAEEACPFDDTNLKFDLRRVYVTLGKRQAPEKVIADHPETQFEQIPVPRLMDEEVHSAYADFARPNATLADICRIRERIAARLFRRGVLARVLIPEQKITGGVVTLQVIEAKIVTVRYQGDIGPVQGKVEAMLDHLKGLAPFDLDTAQRFLLLANDIPGVHASASLLHATGTDVCEKDVNGCAGALDLVVILSRTKVAVAGEVQNINADTLGPWSGIARVDFNSFTALGENTSLIAYTTLGNTAQEVAQILSSARLGNNGLYVAGSFAYGHSNPIGVLKPLKLTGDSYVGTVEIDDPVIRLRRLSLTLGAGIDIISQATTFPGGGVLTDDNLRVVWARAQSKGEHDFAQPVFGFYVTSTGDLNVSVRQGLHVLGASPGGAAALSRPQGQSNAFVARGEGDVAVHLDPVRGGLPLILSARWQGQWANNPLLAFEEQSMGNLTIGRGFDPDTATGDRAIAAEFKTEVGPIPVVDGVKIGPYGFYDVGYAVSLQAGVQDNTLQSAGGGLDLQFPRRIRADLVFAVPLSKALPFATSKPPTEVLLQLVASF